MKLWSSTFYINHCTDAMDGVHNTTQVDCSPQIRSVMGLMGKKKCDERFPLVALQ